MTDNRQETDNIILGINENLADISDFVRSTPYDFGDFMMSPELTTDVTDPYYERDETVLRELLAIQGALEPTMTPNTDFHQLAQRLKANVDQLAAALKARQAAISSYMPGAE